MKHNSLPVSPMVVASLHHQFWRQIFRCPTQRVRFTPMRHFLCESEISQFQIAIHIDEEVLRFQISVQQVALLEVFKGANNGGRIKSRVALIERSPSFLRCRLSSEFQSNKVNPSVHIDSLDRLPKYEHLFHFWAF